MPLIRRKVEDATVWIGYADFLTTLAVLFFVLVVWYAGKNSSAPGFLSGTVSKARSGIRLDGCTVILGERDTTVTGRDGSFDFTIDVPQRLSMFYSVECTGHDRQTGSVTVVARGTTRLRVAMEVTAVASFFPIPGDQLFGEDTAALKPEGVRLIQSLGHSLRDSLGAGQMIAVQGHTDDQDFAPGSGKDNWTFSGQRAAAAAKVLTDPAYGVGISQCRLVIMGFGPSRPVAPIAANDTKVERREKRKKNRRIELRRVEGTGLASGECR